jgi:hypothetical protein
MAGKKHGNSIVGGDKKTRDKVNRKKSSREQTRRQAHQGTPKPQSNQEV